MHSLARSDRVPRTPPDPRRLIAKLTADRIVDAAIARVRASGLSSLTMRKLATDLGTAPMALYRHVEDREDLLRRMLDRIVDQIDVPPVTEDPRTELTGLVTAVHAHFRKDPWVVSLVAAEGFARPGILPIVERMFVALTRAGLDNPSAVASYALIWHFAYGEVIASHGDRRADSSSDDVVRHVDAAQFPTLAMLVASQSDGATREYFDSNLQRLLDGVLGKP